jgi:hypothetical protein
MVALPKHNKVVVFPKPNDRPIAYYRPETSIDAGSSFYTTKPLCSHVVGLMVRSEADVEEAGVEQHCPRVVSQVRQGQVIVFPLILLKGSN